MSRHPDFTSTRRRRFRMERLLAGIYHLTEGTLQLMSAQTDALSAQFDNIQTSLANLATHQNQAFTDLKAAIEAGEDTATLQALTARAQSFTTDIANMDTAATAADPGAAVVTQPGTPAPVTPPTPVPPVGASSGESAPDGADSAAAANQQSGEQQAP